MEFCKHLVATHLECPFCFEVAKKEMEARLFRDRKAKARGEAFVSLFAASKQLVDNFPKRFPYLEYWVKDIEKKGLAPRLEVGP